ncbi:MAG: FHA domain-containing protein [Pseudobdellovibrionaceae bacterium]
MSETARKIIPIKYKITITGGPAKGQNFEFDKNTMSAGRGPENDIVLANDPKVSRKHLEIRQTDAGLFVELLATSNYLLINGTKAFSGILRPGTVLSIGDTDLQINFENPASALPPPVASAPAQKVFSEPLNAPRFDLPPPKFDLPSPAASLPKAPSFSTPPTLKERKDLRPEGRSSKPSLRSVPSSPAYNSAPYSSPRPASVSRVPAAFSPKAQLYLVVGVMLIGVYFYIQETPKPPKTPVEIRTTEQIQNDLLRSQQAVETQKRMRSQNNQDSKQYENAQQYYVKGFRDYRQGQYSRAIQSLQAAISFYPAHHLARKYLDLSRRKLDEFVQYNMLQGRRYKERGNYRLCQASFRHVLVSIMDPNNKTYVEAKQLYDECSGLTGERY